MNHERPGARKRRAWQPCWYRIFWRPRRAIIPKRPSILRWSSAEAGRLPAKNITTHSGVLLCSFISLSRWTLKCWWRTDISPLLKTREAEPDSNTGQPYSLSKRRLAEGFPLWWRAMPVWSTAPTALLWAESLDIIWGMFPSTDLRTPTCSAELEKPILCPFRVRGFRSSWIDKPWLLPLGWNARSLVFSATSSTW